MVPGIEIVLVSGEGARAGGTGVCNQLPGGRGVFINVKFAFPKIGVVSSSDESGGPGRSGMPFGGEGVWNSIREVLNDDLRGGVASDSAESGSDGCLGGDGGGVEVCDCGDPIAIPMGFIGGVDVGGNEIGFASGVLPVGES